MARKNEEQTSFMTDSDGEMVEAVANDEAVEAVADGEAVEAVADGDGDGGADGEDEFLSPLALVPSQSKAHGATRQRQEWFDARITALLQNPGKGLTLNPARVQGRIPSTPPQGETAKGLTLGLAKAVSRAVAAKAVADGRVACYVARLDGSDVACAKFTA